MRVVGSSVSVVMIVLTLGMVVMTFVVIVLTLGMVVMTFVVAVAV